MKGREEEAAASAGAPSDWGAWLFGLIAVAVVLAYQKVWHAGFVWDDGGHVTRPDLRPLHGLFRIWFEPGATQQYYPVLHSAFWLEHRLWGDAALGYHLANVALHIAAAYLLYRLLLRLTVPGALLGASIFALHPVCVESVAWISEQKNTLSGVFCLAAALAYLRFDEKRRWAWYALATLLFALALLSKTVTATLPAALLVIFWWKRGRLTLKGDVLALFPWFCMGAGAGAVTAWMERTFIGASGTAYGLGVLDRFLVAGRALWFYLGKLLWPADLIFIYPHWDVDARIPWQWLFPLAAIGVLWALFAVRSRSRGPLTTALLFAGTLFPALGFINVYPFIYSYVADHFQYLASAALISGAAAGLTLAARRLPSQGRTIAPFAAACALAVLALLTWRQCAMYADMETLWLATLARNPDCWMAHDNLGVALVEKGRLSEAVPEFQRAIEIRPDNAEALNNFGNALLKLGRPDDAIPYLRKALEIVPRFAKARDNLGNALVQKGRIDEAVIQFQGALDIEPGNVDALDSLGNASLMRGRLGEAVSYYERALQSEPGNVQAHNNLGHIFLQTGRVDEAIDQFQKALDKVLATEPRNTAARINLGKALLAKGRQQEAAVQFGKAVDFEPGSAEAHFDLGNAFLPMGRIGDAIAHYQRALEIHPSFAEARNNLGNALLQDGRVDEAIAQYRAAAEINPNNPDFHRNLGAALVKKGRMDEAAVEFQEAMRLRKPQ